MSNAGRVLIIPKGEYDASSTYDKLDLVNYNGISWLAKSTVTGITPSAGDYWQSITGIAIANDLTTTDSGFVLDARQGKVIADELAKKKSRVLLWSGFGVSFGRIDCVAGQENYDEFEILCGDGCILHGYKVYNASKSIYHIQCGYSGMIKTGEDEYSHGSYAGIIDVYDTHFFVQKMSLYIMANGLLLEGKTIIKIYGIA